MPFNWKEASTKAYGARMTDGEHHARIERIITEGKDGPFLSRAKDPQIMVVFANEAGAEVSSMFTLSEKAAWTMARLLSKCGIDLAALEKQKIEPAHFANKAVATSVLVGKTCWIRVTSEKKDNGKVYADVVPIDPPADFGELPVGETPADDDDNPFA